MFLPKISFANGDRQRLYYSIFLVSILSTISYCPTTASVNGATLQTATLNFLEVEPFSSLVSSPIDFTPISGVEKAVGTENASLNGPTDKCKGPNSRYMPLVCWLWGLRVPIPDEKFKDGFITVSIADVICTNFEIGSMYSSCINSRHKSGKSSSPENPAISLEISGISAICKGSYVASGTRGVVTVQVQSSEKGPFRITTSFESKVWRQLRMASKGNVTSCEPNLQVPTHNGIKFSGSFSSKFVDLFESPIAKYVTLALNNNVCPQLKATADPFITNILQRADGFIEDIIEENFDPTTVAQKFERPPFIASINETELVQWKSDVPALEKMLFAVNGFLSSHLDMGVVMKALDSIGVVPSMDVNRTCDDCDIFFRGLNGAVNHVTKGSGSVVIPLNATQLIPTNFSVNIPSYGSVKISVYEANVTGLNSLTNLSILKPVGDRSLSSSLESTDGFAFYFGVNIEVNPEHSSFQSQPLHESFIVKLNTSNVSIAGEMALSIGREHFEILTLADFIVPLQNMSFAGVDAFDWKPDQWACVLTSLLAAAFTDIFAEMKLNVIHFIPKLPPSDPFSNGNSSDDRVLEADLDEVLNNFLDLMLGEYDNLVTVAIKAMVRGPVRIKINELLDAIIMNVTATANDGSNAMCYGPSHALNMTKEFFSFDQNSVFTGIAAFLSGDKSLSNINSYLTCIANFLGGLQVSNFFNLLFGDIKIIVTNVEIKHVEAIDKVGFLRPEDHFHVTSGFDTCLRHSNASGTSNLDCRDTQLFVSLEVHDPIMEAFGSLNLSLAVGAIQADAGAMIQYDQNAFSLLKLHEIFAQPQCLLAPASKLGLYGFTISVGAIEVGVNASASLGPLDMKEFSYNLGAREEFLRDVTYLLTTLLALVQDSLNGLSKMYISTKSATQNRTYLQPITQRSDEDQIQDWKLHTYYLFVILCFVCANMCFFCLRGGADSSAVPDRQYYTRLRKSGEKDRTTDLKQLSLIRLPNSLIFHRSISRALSAFLPIVIVGTIAVFISSNLSTGASVDLVLTSVTGETLFVPALFTFSLGKTVKDMYNAGVYSLMMLVLVFSGIWPYVKLLLMLAAWVFPVDFLPLKKRERLLIWLDALGKFSLVDSFVLVLMMVAFRFHLDVAGVGALDAFVTPTFGFYSFLFATVTSLILGHGVTFLHRQSVVAKTVSSKGPKESIRCHLFQDKSNGQYFQLSRLFEVMLVLWLLSATCLMGIGIMVKSFVFEFKGLTGLLLGDKSLVKYSIISLGSSISRSVEDPIHSGILFVQATYFFFALVMPFTCLGVVALLFCLPMNLKTQRRFFMIAEICNAWSAVEVLLVSLIVSLLELSQFSHFMVGHKCDAINCVLRQLFDTTLHGDDTCFSVTSSIGPGAWILSTGVFLYLGITFVPLRIAHQALNERIDREDCAIIFAASNYGFHETKTSLLERLSHSCIGEYLFTECNGINVFVDRVENDARAPLLS